MCAKDPRILLYPDPSMNTQHETRCIRVRIPDPHYRWLGHRAVDEKRSVGALIREAVRRLIEHQQADEGRHAQGQ